MEIGIRIRLSPLGFMKSLDGEGGEFNQEGMGMKPLLSQWPGPCVGFGLVDIKAEEMATHTAFANDMGEFLTLVLPIQKSEWGVLGYLAVRAVKVDVFLGRGISQCRSKWPFFPFTPCFFSWCHIVHLHLFPASFSHRSSVSTTPSLSVSTPTFFLFPYLSQITCCTIWYLFFILSQF